MSWTKRQFIAKAFEEIGLADYVYDLDPRQLESAMQRMDAMVATWNARGIRISYPIPSSPENSDLDAETTVPDSANQAIILGLAIQLAPGFGKAASPDTKTSFQDAYRHLASLSAQPIERQYPGTLPAGAGNKDRGSENQVFVNPPKDRLLAGGDNELEFE
ncbi:hypothetical protein KAR91_21300 [Candidatus Pacearchaeota archaeon]|nr:hypothetical protein [Candidatus Pacearchaeota archaeon]